MEARGQDSNAQWPNHFPYASVEATVPAIIAGAEHDPRFIARSASSSGPDAAMTGVDKAAVANAPTPLGGIDMDAANLKMQIRRDGKGAPLPLPQQDLEHINLDGLVPVILKITPATATPLLSELQISTAQQAKM